MVGVGKDHRIFLSATDSPTQVVYRVYCKRCRASIQITPTFHSIPPDESFTTYTKRLIKDAKDEITMRECSPTTRLGRPVRGSGARRGGPLGVGTRGWASLPCQQSQQAIAGKGDRLANERRKA